MKCLKCLKRLHLIAACSIALAVLGLPTYSQAAPKVKSPSSKSASKPIVLETAPAIVSEDFGDMTSKHRAGAWNIGLSSADFAVPNKSDVQVSILPTVLYQINSQWAVGGAVDVNINKLAPGTSMGVGPVGTFTFYRSSPFVALVEGRAALGNIRFNDSPFASIYFGLAGRLGADWYLTRWLTIGPRVSIAHLMFSESAPVAVSFLSGVGLNLGFVL